MKGVLLIISSTRMSEKSVEHALRLCSEGNLPLYAAFILDSDLPDVIFDQLTTEGYLGDKPGELVHDAVLKEYEIRGRAIIEKVCRMAQECNVECNTFFQVGNFFDICKEMIEEKKIYNVVITRRKRSNLSRFIFGSSIDELIKQFRDVKFEVFEDH